LKILLCFELYSQEHRITIRSARCDGETFPVTGIENRPPSPLPLIRICVLITWNETCRWSFNL